MRLAPKMLTTLTCVAVLGMNACAANEVGSDEQGHHGEADYYWRDGPLDSIE